MVPKIFSKETLILQLSNDVSHVFFGLLEQKLFRKTKGRQIKSQGCTYALIQEGKQTVCKKSHIYIGQNTF